MHCGSFALLSSNPLNCKHICHHYYCHYNIVLISDMVDIITSLLFIIVLQLYRRNRFLNLLSRKQQKDVISMPAQSESRPFDFQSRDISALVTRRKTIPRSRPAGSCPRSDLVYRTDSRGDPRHGWAIRKSPDRTFSYSPVCNRTRLRSSTCREGNLDFFFFFLFFHPRAKSYLLLFFKLLYIQYNTASDLIFWIFLFFNPLWNVIRLFFSIHV